MHSSAVNHWLVGHFNLITKIYFISFVHVIYTMIAQTMSTTMRGTSLTAGRVAAKAPRGLCLKTTAIFKKSSAPAKVCCILCLSLSLWRKGDLEASDLAW